MGIPAFGMGPSTLSNAVNHDLSGSDEITPATRFDAVGGGFSDDYAFNGSCEGRPMVPELTAFGMGMISAAIALMGCFEGKKSLKRPFGTRSWDKSHGFQHGEAGAGRTPFNGGGAVPYEADSSS